MSLKSRIPTRQSSRVAAVQILILKKMDREIFRMMIIMLRNKNILTATKMTGVSLSTLLILMESIRIITTKRILKWSIKMPDKHSNR